MRKKIITALAILTASLGAGSAAYAECSGKACKNVKVERLYVRNNPTILISTTGDEAALNCLPVEGRYIELRAAHQKYDEIYSLLLAAKLADHNIWIRVRNAPQSPCSILYVVLE